MLFMNYLVYTAIANLYKLSDAFDWLECSPPLSQNFAVSNNLIISHHPAITAIIQHLMRNGNSVGDSKLGLVTVRVMINGGGVVIKW